MANPSKRYPWMTEMYVERLEKWFPMEGFRDEDEAIDTMNRVKRRDPDIQVRVRNFNDQ